MPRRTPLELSARAAHRARWPRARRARRARRTCLASPSAPLVGPTGAAAPWAADRSIAGAGPVDRASAALAAASPTAGGCRALEDRLPGAMIRRARESVAGPWAVAPGAAARGAAVQEAAAADPGGIRVAAEAAVNPAAVLLPEAEAGRRRARAGPRRPRC